MSMPRLAEAVEDLNEKTAAFIARNETKTAELDSRLREIETVGNRPGNGPAATLTDAQTGDTLYALGPKQSIRNHIERKGVRAQDDLRLGDLMRAMVTGARTDQEIQALHKGTDSAGGFAVPEYYSASVIDLMRARNVAIRAGARTVPLEGDKKHFLKVLSDPAVAWRVERAAVAESEPTFGRMTMEPKSLAVIVKTSRELLEDSSPDLADLLENTLAKAFANEVDRVALFGSGVNPEPLGVANTPGINAFEVGVNGNAVTSYADILRARQLILEANGSEPTAAIMAPRTDTAFAGLTDTTGQPLRLPRAIEEIPFYSTTGVPVDETQGTSTNATQVVVGDFTNLWIGVRIGFRLQVLDELFAQTMEVGFLAHLRIDIGVPQPSAFTAIRGYVPAA